MAILLILWLLCGVLCYFIMQSKGYPNQTCLNNSIGGFLLGFFWLFAVLTKKPYDIQSVKKQESKSAIEQLGELSKLREQGAISEIEYESQKRDLLTKI